MTKKQAASNQPATEAAKQFLLAALADGPVPLKEMRRAADAAGITDMDLMRARNAMGIKPQQLPVTRVTWCLALPDSPAAQEGQ